VTHIYLVDNPGITLDGVKRLQKHLPRAYIAYYAKDHDPHRKPDYWTASGR
jgi:hypothetical protein